MIFLSSPINSPRLSFFYINRDAVSRGALAHKGARIVDGEGEVKRGQLQLHAARFYLGEIENLIDERQEVATRCKYVVRLPGMRPKIVMTNQFCSLRASFVTRLITNTEA